MKNTEDYRFLSLTVEESGLKITLNKDGYEEIDQYHTDHEGSIRWGAIYELFDDIRGNSEYAYFDDLGSAEIKGLAALTSAPAIINGYNITNDGYFELIDDSVVYWYPNYMINDPIDILYETGEVFFNKG